MSIITGHELMSFRHHQALMPLKLWTSAWLLVLRLQGAGGEAWFVIYWYTEDNQHILKHYADNLVPMATRRISRNLVLEIVRAHPGEVLATLDQAFDKEFGKNPERASPEVVERFHQSVAEVRSWLRA